MAADRLVSLTLRGYKSYRELENFEPGPITVLVGGNGSGKSNLLSFFKLLGRAAAGELQLAVAEAGGAGALLHDGPKRTPALDWTLEVAPSDANRADEELGIPGPWTVVQDAVLQFAAPDRLVLSREHLQRRFPGNVIDGVGSGGASSESMLVADSPYLPAVRLLRPFLRGVMPYQFQDTSPRSGFRVSASLADNIQLHSDGANLPAFLHRLVNGDDDERRAFTRIHATARLLLPFLGELVLEPANGSIMLRWRERGSERVFDASQASDGMLRILALITLLCQPTRLLPSVMLIDEPELGLHPQAIALIAGLIRQVSEHCQVIVATQSVPFVDEFALGEIVVVGRVGRETTLKRLNEADYSEWLKDYSAGELWRKNVLGGGPGE